MKPKKLALFVNSILLFALAVSPYASPALAEAQATFTVNASSDVVDVTPGDGVCETAAGNGMCTLRAAIMEANVHVGADTIQLPAATYALSIPGADEDLGATGDLDITESLTISGAGVGETIIDAEGLNDRVLGIMSTTEAVTMTGMTIQHGAAEFGGGGILNLSPLFLEDVHLFQNVATFGGAISSLDDLNLKDVVIDHNSALDMGGGIYIMLVNLYAEDTDFTNNSSDNEGGAVFAGVDTHIQMVRPEFSSNTAVQDGGTIYLSWSWLEIEDGTISEGDAGNAGGGIFVSEGSTANLTKVSITSNHAGMIGGGIFVGESGNLAVEHMLFEMNACDHYGGAIQSAGTVKLHQSVLRENSAEHGGALLASQGSSTTIRETLIISNTVIETGGGINNNGTMTITRTTISVNHSHFGGGIYNIRDIWIEDSTLSGNHSTSDGGGLYNAGLHAFVYNSTITGNLARATLQLPSGSGGGVYDEDTYTLIQNTILSGNHHRQLLSLVDDDCYGTLTSGDYNLVGTLSNCSLEAAAEHNLIGEDPLLGELADNGGLTLTHALQEGSPAIDGGNPQGCLGINDALLLSDQRGILRTLDGDKDGTARCDIGAYELSHNVTMYLPLLVK